MSRATRTASLLAFFRDDFRMETWLLAGATIQALSFLLLGKMAVLVTFALVVVQLAVGLLKEKGILRTTATDNVFFGKQTTQIPHADGSPSTVPSDEEITVFVLAARSNHPRGRFAPGFDEIGKYFGSMWRDCATNREKWGFLGKSSTLIATDEDCNNTMVWFSYWKDLDHLQAFAHGDVHRQGLDWWFTTALKKYPSIGIMHETYAVPKGRWETIYYNFRPFGMGATKHLVTDPTTGERREVGPLREAKGSEWKSMKSRMGIVEKSP